MYSGVTLEISLKPFKETTDEYIRAVCERIFDDWYPLIRNRKTVSVMLWCADGSELLDFTGELDEEFEWCEWLGTANRPTRTENDPRETSLHTMRQPYMKNPPRMTYRILKKIVAELKRAGKLKLPHATIRVGETFDIGPEFAVSDFKYARHREITCVPTGKKLDSFGFIDSTAALHVDSRRYAAYPDGIPEGLIFGTFLGKQAKEFLPAMGFDYLWLSNGLGFSANPWDKTGKIFDGENYYPEKLAATRTQVFDFWRLFREECPDIPLEVRGTNNSVGIDYATDGVPLYDIYRAGFGITAPPNSPWAALNDNYGLEIMGHMTRIAELPSNVIPFRFYLHDPWWVNSPWYDRYDGAPSDIYLPMAISRINEAGKVESAGTLNLLSIDNSFGDMPSACINEPIPHLLKAEKDAPDAIAPLVWVYPVHEYTTSLESEMLRAMNEGDNYIQNAINQSFPLSQVVSSDNFLRHSPSLYRRSVLVAPAAVSKELDGALIAAANAGIPVIVYGKKNTVSRLPDVKMLKKVDTGMGVEPIFTAAAEFGYKVETSIKDAKRTPVVLLSPSDGGLFLNTYSRDTTVDLRIKTPLGAPLPCGMETSLENGESVLRLSRAEHRECRIFVEGDDAVISVRENAPVSGRFRRAIRVRGLKNATLRYLPEDGAVERVYISNGDKNIDHIDDLRPTVPVYDEVLGNFAEVKNLTGNFYILTEYREWPN